MKNISTILKKYKIVVLTAFFILTLIIGVAWSQIVPKAEKGQKSYLNQDYLGEKKLPRGWKNNNPGNIKYSPFLDWKGKVPFTSNTDGVFEQFVEFRYGVRALIKDLISKIKKYGNINEIIYAYAPPFENDTLAYINSVVSETGFSPNQALSSDRQTLRLLVIAITRHENGKEWAITPKDFEEGYTIL